MSTLLLQQKLFTYFEKATAPHGPPQLPPKAETDAENLMAAGPAYRLHGPGGIPQPVGHLL